jgi:hypothetical protein
VRDKYAKFGRRLLENVVPRTHDFEGPLCDTAAFPRFSRNFEMNSSELVTIVAEAHDISKVQAQAILDSVLKSIVKAAASDDEVSLAGFGALLQRRSQKMGGPG